MVFGAAKALCAFAIRRGAAVNVLRDWGGADERHTLNDLVVKQGIHGLFRAINNLKDTFGQTGFNEKFRKHQRYRGVALGRFQNDGVAASKGRADVPEWHHCGEVEWHD